MVVSCQGGKKKRERKEIGSCVADESRWTVGVSGPLWGLRTREEKHGALLSHLGCFLKRNVIFSRLEKEVSSKPHAFPKS